MDSLTAMGEAVASNWPVWTVTIVLILAAVIDGLRIASSELDHISNDYCGVDIQRRMC